MSNNIYLEHDPSMELLIALPFLNYGSKQHIILNELSLKVLATSASHATKTHTAMAGIFRKTYLRVRT